ncbi:50S ribosomal protein L3 N(5)-glutamine methyltransferase [Parvibium lacunae]|uniref:Ribosomal protein uL3 glutamine methyltransferase n=1 Tax=Parvibium lacunae TaxID=1888893 RepID=A0A368L7A9_9BURK|nr:50S ribosomal protein L3 N(5)-glutamine methyltransferase [Parvibium lacunae]RCS59555.1 50S ribosomal protein L3 N(5)-glutamine methyltransferase [Parvibium lacunae]
MNHNTPLPRPLAAGTEQLRTIRDFLRYAVSRFHAEKLVFGQGCADAVDEAAYLILHTLHLPLDRLEPFLDAQLIQHEREQLLQRIEQRAQLKIPVAYITHESWLQGYKFYVDERTLIPRSFIAELLKEQLSPWVDEPDQVRRVLDLCTGSGCLAIMAADAFPNTHVDAVDISADALTVATRNVADYGLQDRITLYQSDLFATLPAQRYDLIISNPPYVNADSMQALPAEFRHEPALALAGGVDGMDLVRRMLQQAPHYLTDEGQILVEIGHERSHCEAAFPQHAFTWVSTSAGDDMVFLLRKDQLV